MELIADSIRIFVNEIRAAAAFYRDTLGLPLTGGSPEHGYLVFSAGSLRLIVEAVHPADNERKHLVGRVLGLSLKVRDVEHAHNELRQRGVHFTGVPQTQPWGAVLAHLYDPDGNLLSLVAYPTDSHKAHVNLQMALIFAKDIMRMTAFYRYGLGLALLSEQSSEGFAVFDAGGSRLALHAIPADIASGIDIADPAQERSGTPLKLVFHTADIEATCTRLVALGARVYPPRTAYTRDALDPEGNVFQLTSG